MRRLVAAIIPSSKEALMAVVKLQSSRASEEGLLASANRDAPPTPRADTDAAAGGEGPQPKRVPVERGINRQLSGKYAGRLAEFAWTACF
jgi:hypothetical protein